MRGRRLTPEFFNDDRCWAVCLSTTGEVLQSALTASEAMRAAAQHNVVARRKGQPRVEVREQAA